MTALLSFIILTAYCIYAGTDKSLSATYYKVKNPYLFQLALGLTGFLMMIYLLELTAGKWYQFLSFFATSALIFVAFTPDYRQMLEGAINQLPEPARSGALIEFDYASYYDRSNPLINQLGGVFKLSEEDLNEIFNLAGTL